MAQLFVIGLPGMRYKSPLKIPEKRGPVFRYGLCAIVLGLGFFMFYEVIDGLIQGKMMFKMGRSSPVHIISLLDNPQQFWFAALFNTAAGGLLVWLAIAEVLYAKKHKKRIQNAAVLESTGK
jgi:hypothetical protein